MVVSSRLDDSVQTSIQVRSNWNWPSMRRYRLINILGKTSNIEVSDVSKLQDQADRASALG